MPEPHSTDTHTDEDAGGAPRPWEQPGAVRLDCAPHRGELLQWLALVSLACCVLGFLCGISALVGVPLGAVVLLLARRDLARMDAGLMDPTGRPQVGAALVNARMGVGMWAIAGTLLVFLLALLWLVSFLTRPSPGNP